MLNTVVRPVAVYASECSYLNKSGEIEKLEKTEKRALRKTYEPRKTQDLDYKATALKQ